jgi:two-component system, response regulator / RNA-binding antiterminator
MVHGMRKSASPSKSAATPTHEPALRVLLVDDDPDRALSVRAALAVAGFDVISHLPNPLDLYDAVKVFAPDVVIVDTESPSRDALEHIALVSRDAPKPVVMFASDASSDAIRNAVRAGVSAYVVDGLAPERLQPILRVAVERFEAEQSLREELAETKTALKERKLVERAKGLIMKREKVDEEEAFRLLRKFAMDKGFRMGEASQRMIDILSALG